MFDKTPDSPTTQLAINDYCYNLVGSGKADVIARFYYHKQGIILATSESLEGVNSKGVLELEYEITRRPTGGSAIVVSPELTLCYSIFISKKLLNSNSISDFYKSIIFPFVRNLSSDFTVEGAYYLRYENDNQRVPVVGHAMRSNKEVIQLDGVAHLKSLDIDEVSKLLHLRTLLSSSERNIVRMNNRYYTLEGKLIEQNLVQNNLEVIGDERQILSSLIGLQEIGITSEEYVSTFRQTLEELFGGDGWRDDFHIDQEVVEINRRNIRARIKNGSLHALGHCFVDFLEPEPRIHNIDNWGL